MRNFEIKTFSFEHLLDVKFWNFDLKKSITKIKISRHHQIFFLPKNAFKVALQYLLSVLIQLYTVFNFKIKKVKKSVLLKTLKKLTKIIWQPLNINSFVFLSTYKHIYLMFIDTLKTNELLQFFVCPKHQWRVETFFDGVVQFSC